MPRAAFHNITLSFTACSASDATIEKAGVQLTYETDRGQPEPKWQSCCSLCINETKVSAKFAKDCARGCGLVYRVTNRRQAASVGIIDEGVAFGLALEGISTADVARRNE